MRVHGPDGCVQVHAAPEIAVAVRPGGSVSVTITVLPSVGPAPPALLTVIV